MGLGTGDKRLSPVSVAVRTQPPEPSPGSSAHAIRDLVEAQYPQAERIVLAMDSRSTHRPASRYETFAPNEARRLLCRLAIHHIRTG